MAIVFAVRSDSATFDARYTNDLKDGQVVMGTVTRDVDATAIGGYNINLSQAGASARCISWPFRNGLSTAAISVLMRLKITSTALQGFWNIGQANNHSINSMALYQNATLWQMVAFSSTWNTGVKASSFASGGAPPIGAWCDVVITWTGDTTANGMKLWVDGSNVTSETMTQIWTAPTKHDLVSVGGITTSVPNAHFVFEEFVIWNEVINPASVALTSGTGSLNGTARTAYVDVASYEGGAVDGGAKVKGRLGGGGIG